jgi:arylsulfatase
VWLVIDALRADHLGCYGYEKNTSPFIDSMADENVLFKYAFSQESYTQASTPSYFTSTYPPAHRVLYDAPTVDILDSRFITLAEVLKDANYYTIAIVFNPHLRAIFNFGQGFDIYDDNKKGFDKSQPVHLAYETASKIFDKAKHYLEKNKKRPVFLYMHYRDVHNPYAPPPPYNELFLPDGIDPAVDILCTKPPVPYTKENVDLFISQYDGEIKYTDDWIKKTLKMLEDHNINRQNSIVIITADHGEEFFDYHPDDPGGIDHGRTLYSEQIHVPLIISIPTIEVKKKIIDSYVELNDIVPTVLDALDIFWEAYDQFQGKSLIPLIEAADAGPRTIYSGGNYGRGVIIEKGFKYYVYDKTTKERIGAYGKRPPHDYTYIFEEEVYDITADSHETKNISGQKKAISAKLKKKLDALNKSFSVGKDSESVEADEGTTEQLKALGYL